jgi:hypothetical protein
VIKSETNPSFTSKLAPLNYEERRLPKNQKRIIKIKMRFLYHFWLLICCLALPIPNPRFESFIETALETIGRTTGQAALLLPNDAGTILKGTVKVAFDDPELAKSALEAMAKGATEAALQDPKGSLAIVKAVGRGSWVVVSNAAKDQLTHLSMKIGSVSRELFDMSLRTLSKIPGLEHLAPSSAVIDPSPEESKNLIDAGRKALSSAFKKISIAVESLKTKLAENQLRAIEEGAKGAMYVGQTDAGRTAITEMSEGMASKLIANANSKNSIQLAEEAGRIMTEEALKHPGIAFGLAGTAISSSSPLIAAYLMNSLHEFMSQVRKMVKSVPTQSLQEVQQLGQALTARMEKILEPLLKQAPPGARKRIPAHVGSVLIVQTVTDKELIAETSRISELLKGSLNDFEQVGNYLTHISNGNIS